MSVGWFHSEYDATCMKIQNYYHYNIFHLRRTVDSQEHILKDNDNLAKSTMCCIMFILI